MDTLNDIQAAELEFDFICRKNSWNEHHLITQTLLKEAYMEGVMVMHQKTAMIRRMLSGLEDGFLDVCSQRDVAKTELRLLREKSDA